MFYTRCIESLIVFGTYGRRQIAHKSLESLSTSVRDKDVKIVVSDGTPRSEYDDSLLPLVDDDYIWTPDNVSMATSRNLAVRYAQEKYCFDWIMFVEDDITYSNLWYDTLIDFSRFAYGRLSPLGFAYGVFSASPFPPSRDDSSDYDPALDAYAELYGPRADQRLYKASHYFNVAHQWDPDVLGISSCQTGKINHRNTMRGFCSGYIGHRGLCGTVDGETSTWVDQRDIGPAAFDKRVEGYEGIRSYLRSQFIDKESHLLAFDNKTQLQKGSQSVGNDCGSKPTSSVPMTNIMPPRRLSFKTIGRRFKKALRVIMNGGY